MQKSPIINRELAYRIVDIGGLVVSEYEDTEAFYTWQLHDRDRIISGISKGVLVIEAAIKSGTAITVGFAKSQRKEGFCMSSEGLIKRLELELINLLKKELEW